MRIGIFDITADVKDSVTTLFVKDDDQRVVAIGQGTNSMRRGTMRWTRQPMSASRSISGRSFFQMRHSIRGIESLRHSSPR
jgi:hypothetical protein